MDIEIINCTLYTDAEPPSAQKMAGVRIKLCCAFPMKSVTCKIMD